MPGYTKGSGHHMHLTYRRGETAPVPDAKKICAGCDEEVPNTKIRYVEVKVTAPEPGVSKALRMKLLVCRTCASLYNGELARTNPRLWDRAHVRALVEARLAKSRTSHAVHDRATELTKTGLTVPEAYRQAWKEVDG